MEDSEDEPRDGDGACNVCGKYGCCPHDDCGDCSKCLGVWITD